MPFHACWVIYTVKELDSHAKHGQSFKKRFGRITVFLCPIHTSGFLTSFGKLFFHHGSSGRNEEWNSLYGHFSRKSAPVHTSTSARARARPSTRFIRQHCTGLALKECLLRSVFGCKGNITLFSFPKKPALRKQWMHFVFPGQQRSFASVFVGECFINQAQFDAGFAHRLILKDGVVPAIKDPGHDSELQTVRETAWNVCVLLAIGAQVLVTL